MGTNFHTAWIAGSTKFRVADMNTPLSYLDRAITFMKNVMIGCDGTVSYNSATGVLTWTGNINIYFNNTSGAATRNYIAAGSLTLADGEFAYVTFSETNNTSLTMAKAAITTGTTSNYIAYNILVLGYRNTTDDGLYGPIWEIVGRSAYLGNTFFDANTIAAATADNTPYALPVSEQTMVGRITGGKVAALTAAQIRTLLELSTYFLSIEILATPASDVSTTGQVTNFTAGEAMIFGDVGKINSSGNISIAKSDIVDNAWGLFMATGTVASGATADFLLPGGFARNDAWTWATGYPIYLSTTGATGDTLTQTAPSASNNTIQIIGVATGTKKMHFYPQLVQVEHT